MFYVRIRGENASGRKGKTDIFCLPAVGTYLEYAGYLLALRSGLCDIAGQADCKQIVLYRDRMQMNASELVFNDLHVNGVAPRARQLIYDDNDMEGMVERVLAELEVKE